MQVKNNATALKFAVQEVGRIRSVREFIVVATDLPSCINGQIVEFSKGERGLVMGFSGDEVQILLLSSKASIRAGDKVFSKGKGLSLPVGEGFLGRVVNSLCEAVDEQGPIEASEFYPVFRVAPGVMERIPVEKTLETGTTILDTAIPIAKGQRQLLIGDRLTGKTTVAVDAIINQKGKEVICIYCCIGKTYYNLLKILNLFREKEVMPYTVVVSGIASMSAGEQYLAPYTACMLGEYFMYHGRDVLVVFDDLTKHAWVYRQISLLLERAPGREAYPGDIFYIHSQLMERAGYLRPQLKGGSMTFFPIVEILQGDVTGYISTNLISMTDGQIYFSTALFNKGFKPAIDLGLSVSRIGNKAQWPAMRDLSKSLRLDYLQYLDLLKMTQLRATGLSKEAERRLKRGEAISQILIQDKNKPVSIEEQVIYLYALSLGVLDTFTPAQIEKFKKEILDCIQQWYPQLIPQLRTTRSLCDEDKTKLKECLRRYFKDN
jgi:F-type H+-transporting ATPase subunit alpha